MPILFLALALVVALAAPGRACGSETDCAVAGGGYRIAMPEGAMADGEVGAIVYLHGYRGTPEGVMGFEALRETADRLGVALIAPRGEDGSWGLPGVFGARRDDVAFVDAVVEDAVARFPIDRERIVISGFSLGGSMTWYMACVAGRGYAGYVPIAGAFWEPYMPDCVTPLPELHHVHGRADRTVPLEGRRLSVAVQGDVFRSFALLREAAGCAVPLPPMAEGGALDCARQSCGGAEQELCLHDGGHSVQPEWIERGWRAIAARKGWS